jgi:methionyl-tRNA formyltransferase
VGDLAAPPRFPRRIVFLGTPAAAVPVLEGLVDNGFEVPLVVTRQDARRGRGAALTPSPVKEAAARLDVPVAYDPAAALEVEADIGVIVAYGRLISRAVLERLPMLNLHFSLLPRWRGAAPVERAILAGDAETGVSLMQVEEGLDTGPVYASERVPIAVDMTAPDLRGELVRVGTDLLLASLAMGLDPPRAQVGEATYAAKIEPSEHRLDWNQPAALLDRVVRIGEAWTTVRGRRLKVLASEPDAGQLAPGLLDGTVVGTGEGVLRLIAVQPEGRSPMPAHAWLKGLRPAEGERLG